MAVFTKIENIPYLKEDGDWYKVDGIITEEDITKINGYTRKTILVIENTKGINSELLKKITCDNVYFSVMGGYDYLNREKYQNDNYVKRTMMSLKGLTTVVSYFESIESFIRKEWTDTEKCMFVYDSIVKDFTYEFDYKTPLERNTVEVGLNGVMYKKLVCAGFSILFKEMMDRQGINAIYQNKKGIHSWNIVELEGKLRGIELTWDCAHKLYGNTTFRYFGQNSNFYEHEYHNLYDNVRMVDNAGEYKIQKVLEEGETEYELYTFNEEELKKHYQVISPAINSRTPRNQPEFKENEDIIEYLPIDYTRHKIKQELLQENNYYLLFKFLEKSNVLSADTIELLNALLTRRHNVASDVVGMELTTNTKFTGKDIELDALSECEFNAYGDYTTPFGAKIPFHNIYTISGENESQMFNLLGDKLNKYIKNYLMNTIANLQKIFDELEYLDNIKYPDFNIEIKKVLLETKIEMLIKGEQILLQEGISEEILEKIRNKFNSRNKSNSKGISIEELKLTNIDYLYKYFSDINGIRKICEQIENKFFSDDEWYQKFGNPYYIRRFFKNTCEDTISTEELQDILNDIIDKSLELKTNGR